MSKLRGYSGVVLQQLDLNNIEANSITATNGNFTNLTLSTYTIGTLNVGDLVASGQVVKLTGIPNNSTTEDLQILVRSSIDNNVYRVLDVSINPNTGLIKAGALQLTAVPNIPTGGSSAFYKMLFLHSTGNLYKSVNLQWNEVDEILKTPKLQISSIATPTASTNYPLLIIDNDEIKKAPVADIFYNKSNQSLTVYDIVSSNEIYYKNQTLDQRFEPLGGGGGGGSFVTTDTTQTITATKTFTATTTTFNKIDTSSDVTIGGDMEVYTAITLRDTANNAKTFKLSTAGSTTAPFIRMKNFLHTGNYQVGLLTDETRLYGETCIDFEVDDTNGSKTSYLKVENSNVTCNTNLSVTGNITKSGDAVKTQVENDLLYCKLSGTQTIAGDKTFNGLINASQIQVQSSNESSISNDQPILFLDSNSKIRTNTGLTIKPSTSQLKASSLLCSGNVTGANVTLTNLISPSSASNIDYPLLFLGVSNVIMKGSIEYNHSTEKLKVPKIESDLSTTNIRCNANGMVEFDSGAIFDHSGDIYLALRGKNSTIGYNLAFWETGEVRHRAYLRYRWYIQDTTNTSVFYQRMKLENTGLQIYGVHSVIDFGDNTRILQIENDSTATDHGVFYTHPTSHIFRKGTSWKFKISDTKINAYEELEIGSGSNNKNLIVNGDTSTASITMTTPDEIATGTNRECNIMIHDGNTGGDNKLKVLGSNKLTYNANGAGTLSIPTIKLTGTGTDNSSNDRSLMFLNGSNKIVKSLDDLTFNNFTKTFKASNIETGDIKSALSTVTSSTNTDMALLFQNPSSLSIKKVDLTNANGSYNPSTDTFKMSKIEISDHIMLDDFPLHYTEKIVCTSALNKISTYLSSSPNVTTNLGTWGNIAGDDPYYLSVQYNDPTFIKSIICPSSFTRTYSAWFWETATTNISLSQTIINQSFFGRYFALFNGNDSGYSWRMRLRVRMKNNSTNRISPVIRLVTEELDGTKTVHIDSEFTHYIRAGLAKFSTIECLYIIPNATSHQKYRLDLRVSRGGNVNFQSVLTNNDYKIETFVQTFECLGKSEESSILNPYAQTL